MPLNLDKYDLSAEAKAEIRSQHKESKEKAITKRVSKLNTELQTYKENEAKELRAEEIATATKNFKFKEGQSERALKMAGIDPEDDAATIKKKVSGIAKEFPELFNANGSVGNQAAQGVQPEGEKATGELFT